MPSPTVEQLRNKEISLKKALADMGETPDTLKQRSLRKKLKRTQRRRRLDVTIAAGHTTKPKTEEPKEAPAEKPAEAETEAPAEESKAE